MLLRPVLLEGNLCPIIVLWPHLDEHRSHLVMPHGPIERNYRACLRSDIPDPADEQADAGTQEITEGRLAPPEWGQMEPRVFWPQLVIF